MVDIFIPYIFIALLLILIWIFYRIIIIRKTKLNKLREAALSIFFVYFLVVIYFTFFKSGVLAINLDQSRYMNIIPLKETVKMFKDNYMGLGNSLYNVLGNILLFMPLGFFIPMLFKKCNNSKKILLYGFTASFTIEGIQYFTAMNIADVDDIIFNTLGALLGLICYRIFYKIIKLNNLVKHIDNIGNKESVNLIALAAKPLSVMFIACFIVTFYMVYVNTYSAKLSNNELATKAFSEYQGGKFVAYKKFDKYKLFIRDEGNYVELCMLEKTLGDRFVKSSSLQRSINDAKAFYSVQLIGDYQKNCLTAIVFGRNNNSENIVITLNGKEYSEKVAPNNYFIVIYPKYEKLKKDTDVYNIYHGGSSEDLKIKFTDMNGSVNNDVVFCK